MRSKCQIDLKSNNFKIITGLPFANQTILQVNQIYIQSNSIFKITRSTQNIFHNLPPILPRPKNNRFNIVKKQLLTTLPCSFEESNPLNQPKNP